MAVSMKEIYQEDVNKYGSNVAPQLPWSIQMCITYGCNRAPLYRNRYVTENGELDCKNGCMFCGAASLVDKKEDRVGYNFMSVETAKLVAQQLNQWVPHRRIEINNFGEPLINPRWRDIVKVLRDEYPSVCIQLQTNGLNLYKKPYEEFKKVVDDYFNNGGNLLAIDSYEGSYTTYLKYGRKYEEETGIQCIDFMHDNPENKSYYRNAGASCKELYIVDDLGECDYKQKIKDKKAQRNINNHAGCVDKEVWSQYGIDEDSLPLPKKCSRVFRELIVGFDGVVTICCQDFLRRVNLGVVTNTNLRDIWNSANFNTIRKLLYDKNRDFCTPCRMCSYVGGFRLGFLHRPDGEVTEEDMLNLIECNQNLSSYIHYQGTSQFIYNDINKQVIPTMDRDKYLKGEL